jgi:hypothetical protein
MQRERSEEVQVGGMVVSFCDNRKFDNKFEVPVM